MAINKKLIHFRTKTAFTTELNAGNILDTSIVFIKDTKEIWTHGQLYSCSLTEEEITSIIENSQSISNLTNALNNKVDKVEGKQLSTNDYTTAEKNKLAEALDKLAKIRNTQLSHINDTDTFSATAEKVSLNYDCYVGDQYGAEATSHSVDIPVASETQAGIVTAEDKKAITNLDTTYAKKAEVDKSIEDLSNSIAAGGVSAVIGLTENSSTTYAKSYVLKQGDREVGTINIPKDMVVSSGSLKSVTSADNPYTGAKVGDKYIDLVIANSTSEHIYIPVSDLIDTYLAGNGLILEESTFSIKKDETSESYLTIGADGVKVSGIDKALEGKVDKEDGKSLVLTTEITKLSELPSNSDLNNMLGTKLDASAYVVDSELSDTSTNPVQNKVVYGHIDFISTTFDEELEKLQNKNTEQDTAIDKKLDKSAYVVDVQLSSVSTNPIQNRAVQDAVNLLNTSIAGINGSLGDLSSRISEVSAVNTKQDSAIKKCINSVDTNSSSVIHKNEHISSLRIEGQKLVATWDAVVTPEDLSVELSRCVKTSDLVAITNDEIDEMFN